MSGLQSSRLIGQRELNVFIGSPRHVHLFILQIQHMVAKIARGTAFKRLPTQKTTALQTAMISKISTILAAPLLYNL